MMTAREKCRKGTSVDAIPFEADVSNLPREIEAEFDGVCINKQNSFLCDLSSGPNVIPNESSNSSLPTPKSLLRTKCHQIKQFTNLKKEIICKDAILAVHHRQKEDELITRLNELNSSSSAESCSTSIPTLLQDTPKKSDLFNQSGNYFSSVGKSRNTKVSDLTKQTCSRQSVVEPMTANILINNIPQNVEESENAEVKLVFEKWKEDVHDIDNLLREQIKMKKQLEESDSLLKQLRVQLRHSDFLTDSYRRKFDKLTSAAVQIDNPVVYNVMKFLKRSKSMNDLTSSNRDAIKVPLSFDDLSAPSSCLEYLYSTDIVQNLTVLQSVLTKSGSTPEASKQGEVIQKNELQSLQSLSNVVEKVKADISHLRDSLVRNEESRDFSVEVKTYKESVNDYEENIKKHEEDRCQLKFIKKLREEKLSIGNDLDTKMGELRNPVTEKNLRNEELQTKVNGCTKVMIEEVNCCQERRLKIRQLKKDNTELRSKLYELNGMCKNHLGQMQNQNNTIEHYKKDNRNLHDKLEVKDDNIQRLSAEVQYYKETLNNYKQNWRKECDEMINKYKTKLAERDQEIDTLHKEKLKVLDECKTEVGKLLNVIKKKDIEIKELDDEVKGCLEVIKEEEGECLKKWAENKQLEKEKSEMEAKLCQLNEVHKNCPPQLQSQSTVTEQYKTDVIVLQRSEKEIADFKGKLKELFQDCLFQVQQRFNTIEQQQVFRLSIEVRDCKNFIQNQCAADSLQNKNVNIEISRRLNKMEDIQKSCLLCENKRPGSSSVGQSSSTVVQNTKLFSALEDKRRELSDLQMKMEVLSLQYGEAAKELRRLKSNCDCGACSSSSPYLARKMKKQNMQDSFRNISCHRCETMEKKVNELETKLSTFKKSSYVEYYQIQSECLKKQIAELEIKNKEMETELTKITQKLQSYQDIETLHAELVNFIRKQHSRLKMDQDALTTKYAQAKTLANMRMTEIHTLLRLLDSHGIPHNSRYS